MESNIGQGTVKLYYEDAYRRTFGAKVLSCAAAKDGYDVILDQTAFFPEEGGQSADTGWLFLPGASGEAPLGGTTASASPSSAGPEQCVPVADVRIKGGIIAHRVKMPVPEGTAVRGEIDWTRRFSNMQQHSAEHLISGIVHTRFGYENVGFHLSDREVTMDYSGPLGEEDIYSIEEAANRAVFSNVESRQLFPDAETLASLSYRSKKAIEGQVRLVEFPGYDMCACCAPHVRRTGEIGFIRILMAQNYKGGTRIYMLAGDRAVRHAMEGHRILQTVSRSFSTVPENVPGRVAEMKEQLLEARRALGEANAYLLAERIGKIPPEQANVCLFTEGIDKNVLRKTVNALAASHPGVSAVFDGNENAGWRYILGGSGVLEMQGLLREKFGAKGGGSADMVQGSLRAAEEEIAALFA